jgi:hypothetical protein
MNEKNQRQEIPEPPIRYAPSPMFRFAALLLAVASIWLGVGVWRQANVINIVAFSGVTIAALGMVTGSFAQAVFDGDTLIYRVPLRPTRTISRNQIDSVSLEGRRTRALVIIFHPRAGDGRIETERIEAVNLVPLEDQLDLLERLEGISA